MLAQSNRKLLCIRNTHTSKEKKFEAETLLVGHFLSLSFSPSLSLDTAKDFNCEMNIGQCA